MARYTAEQIYAFAVDAGFNRDEAVTMTAIALAESGGRGHAHNTHGEDSRGLWQINAAAHPDLAGEFNLFDPRQNALAAFRVSGGGADISPWTTTHGGGQAPYVRYRDDAQAAAVASGEPAGLGYWSGVEGYGDRTPAGRQPSSAETASAATASELNADGAPPPLADDIGAALGQPIAAGEGGIALANPAAQNIAGSDTGLALAGPTADPAAPSVAASPAQPAVPTTPADPTVPTTPADPTVPTTPAAEASTDQALADFLSAALSQRGDDYVMGATARPSDADPDAFDCAELVTWAAGRAGVQVVDGSWLQYLDLEAKGMLIPVDEAVRTPGALLFSFSEEPQPGGARPSHSHVAISLGDGRTIEARGRAYGVDSFEAGEGRFEYAALLPGISAPPSGNRSAEHLPVAGPDSAGIGSADGSAVHSGVGLPLADLGEPAAGGQLLDTDRDGLADDIERRLLLDPFAADTDADGLNDAVELLYTGTDPQVPDDAAAELDRLATEVLTQVPPPEVAEAAEAAGFRLPTGADGAPLDAGTDLAGATPALGGEAAGADDDSGFDDSGFDDSGFDDSGFDDSDPDGSDLVEPELDGSLGEAERVSVEVIEVGLDSFDDLLNPDGSLDTDGADSGSAHA